MSILELVFWGCIVGIFYAYFGYPLVMAALARRSDAESDGVSSVDDENLPFITVLIAARDEAQWLPAKLEDVLSQDYPSDQLQILVVSDGSIDRTVEIVRKYSSQGVECIQLEQQMGKEAAQARGIERSRGDYIVFTDVATRIGGDGFRGMVAALASPDVGAVSSEDRFVTADGRLAGEGMYVRYEMWIRQLESRVRGLVGLSGSLFAARRELCDDWPTNVPSDFVVALRCARKGLKATSLPNVHGLYTDLKKDSAEFARKRRTAVRGMAGLASAPDVLSFRRFGGFAFQVWSHKLCRWVVPWLMLGALLSNILLRDLGQPYGILLLLQIIGYVVAVIAGLVPQLRKNGLIRVLYFFVIANLALAFAAVDFLRGHRVVQWEPSVR